MVKIGNKQQCVAEYLNRYIGQKQIVDVVRYGETTYYVFENGYELPILCSCCGTPLVFHELDNFRRNMRGRRLESMSTGPISSRDRGEFLGFQLEFSKKGFELEEVVQAIAPESAARMRHTVPDKSRKFLAKGKVYRYQKKRGFGE
jgi:hypothetical protein